ncbi:hypothetical protein BD414DRAFT_486180 [Trametes punicea]|nr:hypothetical protein BD414DRAFT_486180 [Trametes punicea]
MQKRALWGCIMPIVDLCCQVGCPLTLCTTNGRGPNGQDGPEGGVNLWLEPPVSRTVKPKRHSKRLTNTSQRTGLRPWF